MRAPFPEFLCIGDMLHHHVIDDLRGLQLLRRLSRRSSEGMETRRPTASESRCATNSAGCLNLPVSVSSVAWCDIR